ncbi:PP2C family protein-serine/threonine phosphatase [Nocardioides sp.]|uniref:PP2C family protein-serine/threonine phosphatase n=1 Tax=Nocardioides sp. TaxID=35761 RepID=UPI003564D1BE
MTPEAPGLFALAPCGYAVLRPDGLVLDANVELLRLLARSRDEIVGVRRLSELMSAGGRIYFDTHVLPMLEIAGSIREIAVDVVRSDGTRIPVLLSANMDLDRSPESTTVRVVLLEASDRRRYEADLLEATRAAEASQRESAQLAETLQRTLIPPTPPRIERLSIEAAYRPAGDGREVGGDFYDVFQVGEGEWIVVIGDVMGKGVGAATVTAFLRHGVRALAMRFTDPSDLLLELNRALLAYPTDKFATMVVARLTEAEGDWLVHASVAGHPLPIARRRDGTAVELGTHGPLVGVLDEPVFPAFEHRLGDDVLVLFTDGVIEARRDRELLGVTRLLELIASTEADAKVLTHAVTNAALDFQAGVPRDDIAVLSLSRSPRAS